MGTTGVHDRERHPRDDDDAPGDGDARVARLERTPGRRRLVATGLVAAVLLWGTFWGQDDDFPVGPLRQYSTATDPNGLVWVTHAYGRFDDGVERPLLEDDIGMRIAEFDGQYHRIKDDPELLRPLADAYRERHPDGPRLLRLRLQRDAKKLEGREVVGRRTRIAAEIWVAQDGEFTTTRLHGRFRDEDERRLDPLELGISREEFDRLVAEPTPGLLDRFAADWRRINAHDPDALVGLVLRSEHVRLADGDVVEERTEVVDEVPV